LAVFNALYRIQIVRLGSNFKFVDWKEIKNGAANKPPHFYEQYT